MKTILILISCLAFLNISCATLDGHVYKAKKQCSELFYSRGLNINSKKENNDWNKRQYIQCVSNTAQASATTDQTKSQQTFGTIALIQGVLNFFIIMLGSVARR